MEDLSQKKKFFKITNKQEKHYEFQYTDGLNILKEPFAETGTCVPGGLYFTDADNIFRFLNYGVHLREITLPRNDPNFKIVKDGDKWRANKIILGKRYNLSEKETFEYLVSNGADIRAVDDWSLVWASGNGYLEVVKYLVLVGADIHAMNNYSLIWASGNGYLEVVKYLVSLGARINDMNDWAVRWASQRGYLDVVKYLVELGELRSPVQPVRTDTSVGVVIRDKVELGEFHSPVQPARINNAVITRDKVSVGVDIHALDDYAVRNASQNGHLDVVKYLISVGANIYASNNYAVRWASANGHLNIVEYLLELGAELF